MRLTIRKMPGLRAIGALWATPAVGGFTQLSGYSATVGEGDLP